MSKELRCENTELNFAYLAGLVDGEGSMNFYKMNNKSCVRGYTFVARLTITNKDFETLMQIREEIGFGFVKIKPIDKRMPNRCQAYDLVFGARQVRCLLPKLIPHLRIKKKQAVLLMSFLSRQRWGGRKGLSDSEYSAREDIKKQIDFLNLRGITQTI